MSKNIQEPNSPTDKNANEIQTNQDTSLFSITDPNGSFNSIKFDKVEKPNNEMETENDEDDNDSSLSLDESSVLPTTVSLKEKKLIRGIMMSSHNVSSINELDNNRMLLNAKIISANNRRNTNVDQNDGHLMLPNTATYSVDLSHASRDPMVAAGPNEVFNKNDIKLAIEIKQKKLQQQQADLEKKLKDLELQEMELEKMQVNTNTNINAKDSGIDPNVCSESLDNSSFLTNSNSGATQYNGINLEKKKTVSLEDLKRIEFQNRLLSSGNESDKSKMKSDEVSSSSSSCFVDSSQKLIEERKKEILKRFGIEQVQAISTTTKKSSTTSSGISSTATKLQLNSQVQSDDKYTIYSGDSGFGSSGITANTTNLKPKPKNQINLAVEQLNNEILNAAIGVNSSQAQRTQLKNFMNSQQSQFNMIEYLNGNINVDEYRRRLSSSSGASSSMSINSNGSLNKSNTNQQVHASLFGLEFFDSNNSQEDARDVSLEKMIGWPNGQHPEQEQLNYNDNKTTSSVSYSKKLSISSPGSSNDTSNDEDSVTSNSENTISNDDDEDEDSQALIMSLLNSRQNKLVTSSNQDQQLNPTRNIKEMSFIDMKRQFIQSQLEAVRKQKEQLQHQSHPRAFSHNVLNPNQVNHMPPPIKVHKLIGSVNLHELSTIKEVDTPKSERNLKLNNNKNVSIFFLIL